MTGKEEAAERSASYRAAVRATPGYAGGAAAAAAAAGLQGGDMHASRSVPDIVKADPDSQYNAASQPVHPLDRYITPLNLWSYLSFSWINKVMSLGNQRQLEFSDLPALPKYSNAYQLGSRLHGAWKAECAKNTKNPSMFVALLKAFWWPLFISGILLAVEQALLVAQAVLLQQLLREFDREGDEQSDSNAWKWAGSIIASSAMVSFSHHVGFLYVWRLGFELRAATIGMIYGKLLTVSSGARLTSGKVINLAGNDVERLVQLPVFFNFLWIAPIQLFVLAYLTWQLLGPSAMAGIGLILLCLPLHFWSSGQYSKLRHKTAACTDERAKTMNEVIRGIRVIKMNGWEEPFSRVVAKLRSKEIQHIKQTNYIRGSTLAFNFSAGALTGFLSFITYEATGNTLTAEKVFTTLALYNAVRLSLTLFFPAAIQSMAELKSVFQRLTELMDLDTEQTASTAALAPATDSGPAADVYVETKALCIKWEDGRDALGDVTMRVGAGELLCVAGPVGSGKSTLLLALLGELQASAGTVTTSGTLAYVSQEAWILSGSVRENIVFGHAFDQAWYDTVTAACQLLADLEQFEDGDRTEIGERGITLSGGQRARLSLARAVYSQADIVLMDDPLSAVDAKVGNLLMEECILGLLADKARVLVTHQLQFLPRTDSVLLLGTEGTPLGCGPYPELLAKGFNFATIVSPTTDEVADEEAAPAKGSDAKGAAGGGAGKAAAKTIKSEGRQDGGVSRSTYWAYFGSFGSVCFVLLLLAIILVTQLNQLAVDWFLAYWVELDDDERDARRNQYVYSALVASFVVLCFTRSLLFLRRAISASQRLHDRAFYTMVHASVRFFDTNPIGRIANRFTKDVGYLDDLLPWTFLDFLQWFFLVIGIVILVASLNPWIFIITLPLLIVFIYLRGYYIRVAREVKRLEAVARSPVYSQLNSTLSGLPTIRSHRAEARFKELFDSYLNEHGRAYFLFVISSRWFGFRLDVLTFCFIAVTTSAAVATRNTLNAGDVGLSLVYALQLTSMFQWCVRQSAEVENQMTSVERLVEYTHIEGEETFVASPPPGSALPAAVQNLGPTKWPLEGKVEFANMSLRYFKDGPLVLQDVSAVIQPGEKVGVVGRTGAGKSSLIAALFRLAPIEGSVLIDDVSSADFPLGYMRSKIGVIPQDPVLFSGTVRRNLDPFSEAEDTDLWAALEAVQLHKAVTEMPGGLDAKMTEGGGNFSVGQRQLVCLARAIIRTNKVLILDEATANVDTETDALIQDTIRDQFRNCTVITIAHRLNTVMDSDKIMVMDAGRLIEFDSPAGLLEKRGAFHSLVHRASVHTSTAAPLE